MKDYNDCINVYTRMKYNDEHVVTTFVIAQEDLDKTGFEAVLHPKFNVFAFDAKELYGAEDVVEYQIDSTDGEWTQYHATPTPRWPRQK